MCRSRCHNPYKGMQALQPHPLAYDVTVVTSDIKGAGTDANVFIRIFGTVLPPYYARDSLTTFMTLSAPS